MRKLLFLLGLLAMAPAFAANEPFNTFVSGLSAASSLAGSELFPCIQSGASKSCTPAQLSTYIGAVTDGSGTTTANEVTVSTTTAHTVAYAATLPTAAMPALMGDVTGTAGSLSLTVTKVNGGTVPTSAAVLGTNGSAQPVSATAASVLALVNGQTCNAQSGTTYTFVLGDANNCTVQTNSAANTDTVPPNSSVAFAIGTTLLVQQGGAGITTVSPGSGVTFESAKYGSSTSQGYPLGGIYGTIQLHKVATDTWLITNYAPAPGGFTLSGTCTTSSSSGDATGGTATLSSAGPCTIIVTPTGALPATHAWLGTIGDQTQPYNPSLPQASSTTTAITFDVPTAAASADVVSWSIGSH